jgi:hypothetical protein
MAIFISPSQETFDHTTAEAFYQPLRCLVRAARYLCRPHLRKIGASEDRVGTCRLVMNVKTAPDMTRGGFHQTGFRNAI